MEFHSVASIFPMMSAEEFSNLKASIQQNGQRVSIYTHEGKIVDGRNRYNACVALGIKPHFEEWNGIGLLCDFVWDMNASRRQLTGGALKIAAGKYAIEHSKEQKRLVNLSIGPMRPNGPIGDLKDLEDLGKTRSKTAKKFGIGEGSVQRAVAVIQHGVPELAQAVESDQITVNKAADIAKHPVEKQKEIVSRGFTKPIQQKSNGKEGNKEIKSLGVGVQRAHEAINCLKLIPKNDKLRKAGFQIVEDWIRYHK